LVAGAYDLRAEKGSLVSNTEIGVIVPRGSEVSQKLVLLEGLFESVEVVDEQGTPLSAAEVFATEGGLSPFQRRATTDVRGLASVGPLLPGFVGIGARHEGFVPKGPILRTLAAGASTERLVLYRAAILTGEVVDERGDPVDSAMVTIVGTDVDGVPISMTPASSLFRLSDMRSARAPLISAGELGVVPGPVPPIPHGPTPSDSQRGSLGWVTALDGSFRAEPVPPGRLRAVVQHPTFIETVSEEIVLKPGAEAHVRVQMVSGGTLRGKVTTSDGEHVAYARIEAHGARESKSVRCDNNGEFQLSALPSHVSVLVFDPQSPQKRALRKDITIGKGETKEVDFVLPSPRENVTVSVRDDRGYAIENAQVTLTSLNPEEPSKATQFTPASGDVTMPDFAGLHVKVEVRAPHYAPLQKVYDSIPRETSIEMQMGLSLQGSIRDSTGRVPVENADVRVVASSGTRYVRSDVHGDFAVDELPAGPVHVAIAADEKGALEKDITVAAGGSSSAIDLGVLTLDPVGTVDGTTVDSAGAVVSGVVVSLGHQSVRTDAAGRFHFLAKQGPATLLAESESSHGQASIEISAREPLTNVRIMLTEKHADVARVRVHLAMRDGAVTVTAIDPGSEAERAGVLVGDVLIAIDSVSVGSLDEAQKKLAGALGIDAILRIQRGAGVIEVRVARE
jgi:hypothetical protein